MKEITFELTDFCEHGCEYCSSESVQGGQDATFIEYKRIQELLTRYRPFEVINLSGGEPLAHPKFYSILTRCEDYAKKVWVYSNAIRRLRFNGNVIPGVIVHQNQVVYPNVEEVHILKLVDQGEAGFLDIKDLKVREWRKKQADFKVHSEKNSEDIEKRPKWKRGVCGSALGDKLAGPRTILSSNWSGCDCSTCDHVVVKPDGKIYKSPCNKFEEAEDE